MNTDVEHIVSVIEESTEEKIEVLEELQESNIDVYRENIVLEVYDADKYKGGYEITPKAYEQQELLTKNKVMEKNLIVKEVPFFEVSNLENGTTVYIASEV